MLIPLIAIILDTNFLNNLSIPSYSLYIPNFFLTINYDNLLIITSLSVILLYLFKHLFLLFSVYLIANFVGKIKANLTNKLMSNYLAQNYLYHTTKKNSEINKSNIELENIFNQKLEHSETEYQKLLIENTNIIDEINIAQDTLEAHESEITLLKAELEEVKIQSAGKVDYFKEILSNRNFEITNLESNIAALNKELQLIKKEMATVCENSETISKLNVKILDEKDQLANQMLKMNSVIGSISQQVDSESINVEGLNNHRKNVILANNSDEVNGKSQMKEQINDLVREIDKCIVLLSA
jgi:chromosome segregation ATPase